MAEERKDRRGTPPGKATLSGAEVGSRGGAGRIGNPPFVPTDEQRKLVRTWVVAAGQPFTAIKLGISVDTLQRHFRQEIDEAMAEATATLGSKLYQLAAQGNVPALRFWLISRAKGVFSPRVEVTGKDGGPIRTFDTSKMTAEQKRDLLPLLDEMLGQSGLSEDSGEVKDDGKSARVH